MTNLRVEEHGALWAVVNADTGERFLHLTEEAARLAATDDIATGVTPSPDPDLEQKGDT